MQAEYDRRIKTRIDAPMWIGGKAVETKEVEVPGLAAGATQAITLTPDGAGIVAWRYHKK